MEFSFGNRVNVHCFLDFFPHLDLKVGYVPALNLGTWVIDVDLGTWVIDCIKGLVVICVYILELLGHLHLFIYGECF